MRKNNRLLILLAASAVLTAFFIIGFILRPMRQDQQYIQAALVAQSSDAFIKTSNNPEFYPMRNWDTDLIEIDATSALAIEFPSGKILYSKNIHQSRPIASISKLVTALAAIENMEISQQITITKNAVETPENSAHLQEGQVFTVQELLYALLLESSNDAAVALAQHYDMHRAQNQKSFIASMNEINARLNLQTSYFAEPTGLSPQNISSAFDIAQILYASSINPVINEIISTPRYLIRRGQLITHEWVNSNNLLLREDVIGGKTGFTDEAGGSIAILADLAKSARIAIVVLNAQNRELQGARLLDWLKNAYIWRN